MQNRTRVVAYLVASPGDLINMVAITSVFSYAKRPDGKPAYVSKILTTRAASEVHALDGLTVSNCIPYSDYTGPIDTLVVLGGEGAFGAPPTPDVVRWLRTRAPRARRVVSVCTGAFLLAPTGILDGKRVTTHWHHAHRLAKLYPKLVLTRNTIFMKDGKTYSTAGVTAGFDMALALVEEDWGRAAAASIAHTLLLYVRRAGDEDQRSPLLAQQTDVSGPMRDLPSWASSRLTQRLDVATLAKFVAMTPRTFARQFEQHFHSTPARWVQALRVEAASVHLGTGDLPFKVIAKLTGFRDEQALRRAFMQQLSMTPKEYRAKFGLRASPIGKYESTATHI